MSGLKFTVVLLTYWKVNCHKKKFRFICTLSKQQYYSKFFNDNLTNKKKTWEGINNVLACKLKNTKPIASIKVPTDNDSVTCDQNRIANVLNDHFASVGPKLANKLPTVQRNYFDFMNRSNSPDSSFAFNLVTPTEVELEILRIPNNKSHGLYSCPTQLLKYSSNVVSSTLPEIIINNKYFYFVWDVSH